MWIILKVSIEFCYNIASTLRFDYLASKRMES